MSENADNLFSENKNAYSRFRTRVVNIGNIPLGGNYPIRIQSMTNTNTLDTKATVEQSIRMINSGCEYVRITAPGIREAENLRKIKSSLKQKGYHVPLIADIHYNPKAAEIAASIVEKVRINPGNYIDKKRSSRYAYSEMEYNDELRKIKQGISPLIKICKEHDTAIRIGTNHGSLSDRIVDRYGDTPKGMVESAFEFIHICNELNFDNIVLSMKASNTRIMVEAYRMLVLRMMEENINFPLHLGVTEAGAGEDGRIKSAVGIGTLLEDGIGDTIRVSLTEDPEFELPVAKIIADRYNKKQNDSVLKEKIIINTVGYKKRPTQAVKNIGGNNVPVVIADLSDKQVLSGNEFSGLGFSYFEKSGKWIKKDLSADFIYVGDKDYSKLSGGLSLIVNSENYRSGIHQAEIFPLFTKESYLNSFTKSNILNFISVSVNEVDEEFLERIKQNNTVVVVLENQEADNTLAFRKSIGLFEKTNVQSPVVVKKNYSIKSFEEFALNTAVDYGTLLLDGLIEGIWIKSAKEIDSNIINSVSFNILQASRSRISKTEYISCPSCGRTMFNIMEATTLIKERTQHLKGLKISIMGCIVNGPGEMADADYGYVGAGAGKVNLYKGQLVVKKGISESIAIDSLIELIKENGDWLEP